MVNYIKYLYRLIFVTILLLNSNFSIASQDWPEIPVPPKSQVEWVAEDLRYNGLPMRVQRFESKVSAQEILAYYRAHWSKGELQPKQMKAGEWDVISMPHGPFFMTVQVKDVKGGFSEGRIGVSALDGKVIKPQAEFLPKPSGSTVISVVESKDPGRSSRQVILANGLTISSNASYYEGELTFQGWKKLQGNSTNQGGLSDGYFAIYQKGKEQIDVAVSRHSDGLHTMILANVIRYE